MQSETRQTIIILPNVEMYANFVAADGDNPAYFNVAVTPLENSEGADIFILSETDWRITFIGRERITGGGNMSRCLFCKLIIT